MNKGIVECLFYRLHNSILLGNSHDAETSYALLKEEYENDDTCFEFLREDSRWDLLCKMIEVVKNKYWWLRISIMREENQRKKLNEIKMSFDTRKN